MRDWEEIEYLCTTTQHMILSITILIVWALKARLMHTHSASRRCSHGRGMRTNYLHFSLFQFFLQIEGAKWAGCWKLTFSAQSVARHDKDWILVCNGLISGSYQLIQPIWALYGRYSICVANSHPIPLILISLTDIISGSTNCNYNTAHTYRKQLTLQIMILTIS